MDGTSYRRIVLSPHLDDGPLSCGGAIHHWAAAGEPVLVVTFMTGDPPAGDLSPFAHYQHAGWQLPAREAYIVRRAEEVAALQVLGADFHHAGWLDCIYRADDAGSFYASDEAIFGVTHPGDDRLAEEMARRLAFLGPLESTTIVYAPLAVGNHIDHQLVRQAAERWRGRELIYYEDFPYVGQDAPVELDATPLLISLSKEDIEAKVKAIGCYRSQIRFLFDTRAKMVARVWDHCRRVAGKNGWAERYWQKVGQPAQSG